MGSAGVPPDAGDDTPGAPAGGARDAAAPAPPYAAALQTLTPAGADAAAPAPTPSAALDAFLAVHARAGMTLYPAQEEALLELADGRHVILATPTGSGKSLVAEFVHFLSLSQGRRSYYTCPIKALVSEKFFALCRAFGPDKVGMMTGDASVNRDAPILCCTAEILANIALTDEAAGVQDVVMDEFHYYGDAARGTAWQLPLICCPNATFLLMSATLGDTTAIAEAIERDTGRALVQVVSAVRPVPLNFRYQEVPLTETLAELDATGRTPAYVVHFSQREAVEAAQSATSTDFLTKAQKVELRGQLQAVRFDTPFGRTMRRLLGHGIGVHHAGLLPKYRLLVEKLAQSGALRVIMGTDTLGVGINVPIRSVVLTKLCKFDGSRVQILPVREFRQIAGRAGRAGYDDAGDVLAQAPEHVIENKRLMSRAGDDPKKQRKVVKKKPPAKGYVPWDEATFRRLQADPPEPLVPRFVLSQHVLLTVLQHHARGYAALVDFIARSHVRPREKAALRRRARALFVALRRAKVVVVVRAKGRLRAPRVTINEALGEDFSLTHALTLFVLDTLPHLNPEAESYPLDVLSVVESILDNPDAVLRRQADKARDAAMDAMRAEGLDYEARMAELEKVTYPKPLAEFLWARFDTWLAAHAWAGDAHVRPKGVARQMVETCASFADFVRELGLERQEGVLLRYLSDVLRALQQNLPAQLSEGPLLDTIALLRTMTGQVDASLVEAWGALVRDGTEADAKATGAKAGTASGAAEGALSAHALWRRQPKVLMARLRGEMHRLLAACGRGDWAAAIAALAALPGEPGALFAPSTDGVGDVADAAPALGASEAAPAAGGAGWSLAVAAMGAGDEEASEARLLRAREALAAAFAPLAAEYGPLDFSPNARRPVYTQMVQAGDVVHLQQTLLVAGEPTPYVLCCAVPLARTPLAETPLLHFVEVRS